MGGKNECEVGWSGAEGETDGKRFAQRVHLTLALVVAVKKLLREKDD